MLWVFVVRMLMCVRYCGESDFLNQFGSGKGRKCEIPVFWASAFRARDLKLDRQDRTYAISEIATYISGLDMTEGRASR